MNTSIPVLEDLLPLENKKVLLRADFNVPLEHRNGTTEIADDFRIVATLPTIEWLLAHGAHVTACTHLGRPKGKPDPEFSVAPVRARLSELAPGVELLENLRFDPGEEGNDIEFAKRLIAGFDCYVNDAFGASHREHASIVGPPKLVPSAGGRLLEREVEVLARLFEHPQRPFVAVIGGAKIADKLGVLRSLAPLVDRLVIGGAMAFTFLAALGHEIGDSLLDPSHLDDCAALLAGDTEVILPVDFVVANAAREDVRVVADNIAAGFAGFDIGPESASRFAKVIGGAASVLWNGPMGVFEDERFAAGTRAVAEALATCPGFTVVGGGDSAAAIDAYNLESLIDHVSTGGGATLEFIEHGDLPGLAALRDSKTH